MVSQTSPATEVSIPETVDLATLKDLKNWEDVRAYFADQGITVSAGEEVSDGYERVAESDKRKFVGTPFIIIDFVPLEGDQGPYATIRLMTAEGGRYRMADGSAGIYTQLMDIAEQRRAAGHPAPTQAIAVKGGLRVSEYYIHKETQMVIPRTAIADVPEDKRQLGRTYYLDFTGN